MHTYFDALVSRPDHWRSASLRDVSQLNPPGVTYDPVMDAAKVTIPAFFASSTLAAALSETTDLIAVPSISSYPVGRVFKIDSEIFKVTSRPTTNAITVARGQYGTTPSAHATGATISLSTNNLKQQVRIPLGTEDGHSYLFTWDAYWTGSFLGMKLKHKAFQFPSGGQGAVGKIWLEPSVIYSGAHGSGYVGEHDYRWYNVPNTTATWAESTGDQVGPGTKCDPDEPQTPFPVALRKWTRFWLLLEQRANDWDRITAWVSDEDREARHVFDGLLVSVLPTGTFPNSVQTWWIEFNSSTDEHQRLDQRDLVAYVRNFVALRDPVNVPSLLIRPEAGVPVPWHPRPPSDIRVYAA